MKSIRTDAGSSRGVTAEQPHEWQHRQCLCRAQAAELVGSTTAELAFAAWGIQNAMI